MKALFPKLRSRLQDATGAAIALVALTMVVLLSCVALAVDVGMLVTARSESQALGDAAALAGAGVLRDTNGQVSLAHDSAVWFASSNTVRGTLVPAENLDVQVFPDEWTVRVRVETTQPTFFARIFGVQHVDISTNSAAWAIESATIGSDTDDSCPALPLTLLPKYIESNEEDGWQAPEEIVGWGEEDHGTLLRLYQKKNAPDERPEVHNYIDYCLESSTGSSYRCYWHHPDEENPSTGWIEQKIAGEDCSELSIGNTVNNSSGANQSVIEAWKQLILNDPNDLEWSEDDECVISQDEPDKCFTGLNKRLRTVPVIDPTTLHEASGSNIHGDVEGFVGVFVENVSETWDGELVGEGLGQAHVYLRIVQQGGTGSADDDGESDPEATVRTLQLID